METMKVPRPVLSAELSPRANTQLGGAATEATPQPREVEITIYSGATVPRYSSSRGQYELTLSTSPEHVRLDRLQSGRAPILNSHSDWSLSDVLGYMKSAELKDGRLVGSGALFSGDGDADSAWNKIQQGGLRNVSVGAAVYRMKDLSTEEDKVKRYLAIDWEPLEVSLVPIGADPQAQINLREGEREWCDVDVEEGERAIALKGDVTMEKESMTQAGNGARTEPDAAAAIAAAAVKAERERVAAIRAAAAPFQLEAGFVDGLVKGDFTAEQARNAILTQLAERSASQEISGAHSGENLRISVDERDKRRQAGQDAVLHAMNPARFSVDGQNPYRGMTISRLAEGLLTSAGVSVRGKTKSEIAELSMHNTADFPLILADSARKQMLAAYSYAQPTYKVWAKASTAPDFKTMSRLRLGETPSLLRVPEGAQITLGTMTESREQYAIATYGRGVSFTRQMLINDDLGAFNDLISAFGLQAARLENQTVYAILTANAAMSDGVALFHANHGNLGTGVIANAGLDAMFTAMGIQKGLDGSIILGLSPRFLIVPKAKEATAITSMISVPSVKISDQNWFAGRLEVVADGVLDASSTAVWYGAADPAIAPGVEYAYLEGAAGPQILRKDNESAILGVQLYAYLDFGAKAVDWRPLYKSSGS